VWETCRLPSGFTDCNVFRYRISTGATFRVPNPGKQQFGSAVSADGTVYFFRSGGSDFWHCGRNGRLLRYPVGGPTTVFATLPDDKDLNAAFAFERRDGSVSVFFEQIDCATFTRDIYRVANADSA
jgi:hypothetical protein